MDVDTQPDQKKSWLDLRRQIVRTVNKLNVKNIKPLLHDIFQVNLVRGRGVLARSLLKGQIASPTFTHVYAAFIAFINAQLPEVGQLIIQRLLLQFRRSYRRNDKIVCSSSCKFFGHLVNQGVISELVVLQICTLFFEKMTSDSMELMCVLLMECGATLSKEASVLLFKQLREILHKGVDYRIEILIDELVAQKKMGYPNHPTIIPELDLVDEANQIEHELDLDEEVNGEDQLNIFQEQDPSSFQKEDEMWQLIAQNILGQQKQSEDELEPEVPEEDASSTDSELEAEAETTVQPEEKAGIQDFTEQDLMNLRRTVYLCFTSSLSYQECVHKLLKLRIAEGQELEVCSMFIDCCGMEKCFSSYYPLGAERLCRISQIYQKTFEQCFRDQYQRTHRLETSRLRNVAKFFAYLLFADVISYEVLGVIVLTEEATTSSSRIFLKILLEDLFEQMGQINLTKRFKDPAYTPYLETLMPKDSAKHIRFSINFFTAIGLGFLTNDLREYLQQNTEVFAKQQAEESMKRKHSDDAEFSFSSSDSE